MLSRIKNRLKILCASRGDSNSTDIFDSDTRLLVDQKRKMVLLWSAKAGCSFTVKWFFYQMNLLDAANHYNPWIHDYREEVFYKSHGYREGIKDLRNNTGDYNVIKFVRNPYSRAVSSLFHVSKGYVRRDVWAEEMKRINQFVPRILPSENGETISFKEFVEYLKSIDIASCDIHWREQVHPLEKEGILTPDYVIKIENSLKEIPHLEQDLGLRKTNLHELRESGHHLKKVESTENVGGKRIAFSAAVSYPDFPSFYDQETMVSIYQIYKSDFEKYGYSKQVAGAKT